jgi:hypothetical protein
MGTPQLRSIVKLLDDLVGDFFGHESLFALRGEDDFILGSIFQRSLDPSQAGFFRQLLAISSKSVLDLVIVNNHMLSLCFFFRQKEENTLMFFGKFFRPGEKFARNGIP